jgi:hypothetical protein
MFGTRKFQIPKYNPQTISKYQISNYPRDFIRSLDLEFLNIGVYLGLDI